MSSNLLSNFAYLLVIQQTLKKYAPNGDKSSHDNIQFSSIHDT